MSKIKGVTVVRRFTSLCALAALMACALPSANAAAQGTPPCGLSYQQGDWPPYKIIYWQIRNCGRGTLRATIDMQGTTDVGCISIPEGRYVSGRRAIASWAAVRGLKRC